MTKLQFILRLNEKLSSFPESEVIERLNFYSEMIEDRVEEGLTEEEAVADIGDVDEIAAQIAADIPLIKIAKKKIKPDRHLKAWEIVLIAIGFPVWFPLVIVALSVVLALYIVLWSLLISAWAIFASLAACSLGCASFAIVSFVHGNVPVGIAMIGIGFVCSGLAVFAFFGCRVATCACTRLVKATVFAIKKCFIRKGTAK